MGDEGGYGLEWINVGFCVRYYDKDEGISFGKERMFFVVHGCDERCRNRFRWPKCDMVQLRNTLVQHTTEAADLPFAALKRIVAYGIRSLVLGDTRQRAYHWAAPSIDAPELQIAFRAEQYFRSYAISYIRLRLYSPYMNLGLSTTELTVSDGTEELDPKDISKLRELALRINEFPEKDNMAKQYLTNPYYWSFGGSSKFIHCKDLRGGSKFSVRQGNLCLIQRAATITRSFLFIRITKDLGGDEVLEIPRQSQFPLTPHRSDHIHLALQLLSVQESHIACIHQHEVARAWKTETVAGYYYLPRRP
ncbi:hypothetical protein VNO77_02452 [Canavalia gladiata]|uniref:Uncharacterized protein n=1 Tax=Canavalia gladiata TaxID=3824 RepID=A0AAN9MZI7_CANGL